MGDCSDWNINVDNELTRSIVGMTQADQNQPAHPI